MKFDILNINIKNYSVSFEEVVLDSFRKALLNKKLDLFGPAQEVYLVKINNADSMSLTMTQ